MKMRMRWAGFLGICWLGWVSSASAMDAVFVDGGAPDAPDGWIAQLGARWDWAWQRALVNAWHTGGAWELAVASGRWYDGQASGTSVDVSFTPEIRLTWRQDTIIEGGVGARFIINRPNRRLSTALEFGSLLGAGYRITDRVFLGYRFLHLSNGGIRQPNGGVNFHLAHIEYHY